MRSNAGLRFNEEGVKEGIRRHRAPHSQQEAVVIATPSRLLLYNESCDSAERPYKSQRERILMDLFPENCRHEAICGSVVWARYRQSIHHAARVFFLPHICPIRMRKHDNVSRRVAIFWQPDAGDEGGR